MSYSIINEEEDHYLVNYNGMIPILTKAVQDQQTQIEEKEELMEAQGTLIESQANQIFDLTDRLDKIEALLAKGAAFNSNQTNVQLNGANRAYIEQNQPNLFYQNTTINYFLPEKTKKAQVHFVDASGRVLKVVNLTTKGVGQINLQTRDMPTGVYNYILVVDGQRIATKKMVLSSNR